MVSKYESKAKKELREDGWLVDWKIRPMRPTRGYTVDYFNAFDILAYKPNILRMISVKGHGGVPKAHRTLLQSFEFKAGIQKEIWVYRDKLGIKKEIIK